MSTWTLRVTQSHKPSWQSSREPDEPRTPNAERPYFKHTKRAVRAHPSCSQFAPGSTKGRGGLRESSRPRDHQERPEFECGPPFSGWIRDHGHNSSQCIDQNASAHQAKMWPGESQRDAPRHSRSRIPACAPAMCLPHTLTNCLYRQDPHSVYLQAVWYMLFGELIHLLEFKLNLSTRELEKRRGPPILEPTKP